MEIGYFFIGRKMNIKKKRSPKLALFLLDVKIKTT